MRDVHAFGELLAGLMRPGAVSDLAALAACLGVAFSITWLLDRSRQRAHFAVWLGERGWDGVLFPLLAFAAALLARWATADASGATAVFRLAVPILGALAVIRVAVRVLHVAFPASRVVRVLERTLSWGAWVALALWFTGVLPDLLQTMQSVSWSIGGAPVTLRDLLEGLLTAGAVLVGALWMSAALEARLMRAAGINLSVRKMAANALRAGLLLVALLLALSAAGIPLGALGVLGGAVGVGIGFGLQKLASNYVSGFVILAERSLRIGDMVKVDGFEGRITDISTRYTVVRSVGGRESIVPNEMLITQRIENASLADPKVALTTAVQVAYGTDVEALIPVLVDAVQAVDRVLADPGPGVQLSAFAADGLELTVVFWIGDLDKGTGNARSAVNLALLRAINAQGVEIPFPQRVLHQAPPRPATAAALGANWQPQQPPLPLPATPPGREASARESGKPALQPESDGE